MHIARNRIIKIPEIDRDCCFGVFQKVYSVHVMRTVTQIFDCRDTRMHNINIKWGKQKDTLQFSGLEGERGGVLTLLGIVELAPWSIKAAMHRRLLLMAATCIAVSPFYWEVVGPQEFHRCQMTLLSNKKKRELCSENGFGSRLK